jgi:ribosome-binding factor A
MYQDSNRRRRVAELLKRELAVLIQHQLNDPRVQGVTLTATEVARDLSSAKVYFTCLAGTHSVKPCVTALNKAAHFLRRQLMDRLTLRSVPTLRFYYDESVERGAALSSLIDSARLQDKRNETD